MSKENVLREMEEITKRFIGMPFTQDNVDAINASAAMFVERLIQQGEIDVNNDRYDIYLSDDIPPEILQYLPFAVRGMDEYGTYRVTNGLKVIGYVAYGGEPEQDMSGDTAQIGMITDFDPVKREEPNATFFIDGKPVAEVYAKSTFEDGTMVVSVQDDPFEMTEREKYQHAVLALQAIAQRKASEKVCGFLGASSLAEASAFRDCKQAAIRALKYIGEPVVMPNRGKEKK